MIKTFSSQAGFTLIEVLVAITLLLMVIVGPLEIISHTNNSTAFATEQMTGWFLAQEGLELVQQGRDEYLLHYFNGDDPTPWADFVSTLPTGFYKSCFAAAGCNIAIDSNGLQTVTACGGTACQLNFSSNGRMRYSMTGSLASYPVFTRTINMKVVTAQQEVSVVSIVSWRTGSLIADQQVQTKTSLFNIYDKP